MAKKGGTISEEHKRKISEHNSGKVFTKEHRLKLAAAKLGKKRGKLSEEHKKKLAESNSRAKGGRNPLMNTAYYNKAHYWIKQRRGKPSECQACGTKEAKVYQWANISQQYLLEESDWMRLCVTCHHRHDVRIKTGNKEYGKQHQMRMEKWKERDKILQNGVNVVQVTAPSRYLIEGEL